MNEFDENNSWHSNVNLVFGFQCHSCDLVFDYDESQVRDPDEDFLGFCVDVANQAQSSGWSCVREYRFLCSKCTK